MKSLRNIVLILLMGCSLQAQFTGGFKDGYDYKASNFQTSIYTGGSNDGAVTASLTLNMSIYEGGNLDGYQSILLNNSQSIYSGGNEDGYVSGLLGAPISIFSGGNQDGYAFAGKFVKFVWSGAIGTGWNVNGNWQDGIIPNINSRVVIPAEVPNFPAVNAGLLSVGEDINGGVYLCKAINIQSDAQMTLRINAFTENYGEILVNGQLFIHNTSEAAFQNLNNGTITINDGGLMWFQN